MADTRKNRVLLKLIRSTAGKKIIFVKYHGTLEQITEFLDWESIPHAVFHGQMTNQVKDEQNRNVVKFNQTFATWRSFKSML